MECVVMRAVFSLLQATKRLTVGKIRVNGRNARVYIARGSCFRSVLPEYRKQWRK